MTVGELGQRMASPELVEWVAFYQLESKTLRGELEPLEYDDPEQHSAAIDDIFRRL